MSSVNTRSSAQEHLLRCAFNQCINKLPLHKVLRQRSRHSKHNMRAFVLLACVALAYGRPEPPVGYSYSAPSTRYSSASLGGGHSSGGSISGLSFGGGHSSGGLSGGGLAFGDGHSSGGLSGGGISFGGSSGGFGGSGSGGLSLGGGDSGFGGGIGGGFSGASLVQKHIYVHVPPPEPEQQRIPNIPAVAPPQKHYKIIFIKAPAPPAPAVPIIPVQPQNEEKTLVYVLVKKPEEQPDIVIPTPAPTQPSKPEVYFIKYQTQTEGGIGGGIGGGSLGGGAIGGGSIGGGSIGGGDELSAIALGGGSGIGGGIGGGSGGHGSGAEISGDFGTSGGDDGATSGHGGATSTQYGPPGHVAGPLH